MPLKSRLCSPVCALVCMRPSWSRKRSHGVGVRHFVPGSNCGGCLGKPGISIVPGVIAGGFSCCAAE